MSFDDPNPQATARRLVRRLNALEREILECVAQGASNEDIAAKCNLSPAAISVTRDTMMRVLGAETTADAVRIAIQAGLGEEKAG